MLDLILKNALPFPGDERVDMAVENGKIVAVEPSIEAPAAKIIDASGLLLIPSFVDSHMHLDKALVAGEKDPDGLMEAIRISGEYQRSVPADRVVEDILSRARRVVEMELVNGSGALKSHVLIDPVWGTAGLTAILELKREFRGVIDVFNIVPWHPDFADKLDRAAKAGEIDFIAGYPTLMPDYRAAVDQVFERALRFSIPVDLHVDESDEPNIDCFEYVLQKTLETSMQGRVNCSHVTALCAVDDQRAARAIELCAKAQVNIITLPSCNMFLMGRKDSQPIRRGITRVHEFLMAGVNVAYASDNIRDPFRPFGNGDMLEEGLFAAQVMQYGTSDQLGEVLRMGTYRAARNTLIEGYGLCPGCTADLTLIEAPSAKQALIGRGARKYVFKRGRLVAKDGARL